MLKYLYVKFILILWDIFIGHYIATSQLDSKYNTQFFLKKDLFIIIKNKIIDNEFWSKYNKKNTTFQNDFFLYIIVKYIFTIYNKLACYISFLGDKVYIQKIIISIYLKYCLKVF